MNRVLLSACALFLVSCAQRQWQKPGADDIDLQQDLATARYNAQVATVGIMRSYSSPYLNSSQRAGESLANGMIRGLEQQKLIRMYMEMNGWRLERVISKKKTALTSSQESIADHEAGEIDYQ